MEIVPAIDIIEGKCVRLSQGNFDQKRIYSGNALEVAQAFEGVGLKRLHLVDLDGAKGGQIVNYAVLERIASHTNLQIDFGGGVKSDKDLSIAFECGARQVTIGSLAISEPETFRAWLKTYGNQAIILGADIRDEKVAIKGWLEQSELGVEELIQRELEHELKFVICTDISKDGMLRGPNFDLYQKLIAQFPEIYLIASGGVSCVADLERLAENGLSAAIVGKAYYEERISLKDLARLAQC